MNDDRNSVTVVFYAIKMPPFLGLIVLLLKALQMFAIRFYRFCRFGAPGFRENQYLEKYKKQFTNVQIPNHCYNHP